VVAPLSTNVIALTREPIDIAALGAPAPADGAACTFVGVVRDLNAGRAVRHLEYEAFEEMALPLMEEIAAEARRRWPVTAVTMVHRLGRLEIGEASVAVAVFSPHRAEAFEACRYVIDTLKATVPIWKKEFYADGAVWVDPQQQQQ
jgi:molybdopterin synthase catalytic subunit